MTVGLVLYTLKPDAGGDIHKPFGVQVLPDLLGEALDEHDILGKRFLRPTRHMQRFGRASAPLILAG